MIRSFTRLLLPAILLPGLAGCKTGDDYHRPAVQVPDRYGWKTADPSGAAIQTEWWKAFHDPMLDSLLADAARTNPDLQTAAIRVEEARTALGLTAADFYPSISFVPSAMRARASGWQPIPFNMNMSRPVFTDPNDIAANAVVASQPSTRSVTYNDYRVPFYLSWEIDLWGRVRRSSEAALAYAEGSAAAYFAGLNSVRADIAVNYFLLRSVDSDLRVLRRMIDFRRQGHAVMEARFRAGVLNELEYRRSSAELASTEAELASAQRRRGDIVALLLYYTGRTEGDFPENPLVGAPPSVPPGLPSDLLERRPDIAEVERRMIARNAEVGAVKATYFPAIRLTGSAGFESDDSSKLFNWDSRAWSFGVSGGLPIFDGFRTKRNVEVARLKYQESVNDYSAHILNAVREVNDSLRGLRLLADEEKAQAHAFDEASRLTLMAKERYDRGLVNYLELVDAERTALQFERRLNQIRGERYAATIRLIKALGGGWSGAQLAAAGGH